MSVQTPAKVSLPVKNKQIEDLLLWRDTSKSSIALGAATAAFLVLQYARFNAIATTAYALISLVLGSFIWNNIAAFTHRPPVPVPRVLREGVSEAEVRPYVEKSTLYVNKALAFAHRLATGREAALSGSAIAFLYTVAKVSSLFSLVGLAYTVVLLAFTLPKVYELKKDDIDAAVDQARKQLTTVYDKYLHKYASRIPRASTAKPAESSTFVKKEE
ncbi:hypothetical protein N2152v2_005931 [Parachlorella kessleri]